MEVTGKSIGDMYFGLLKRLDRDTKLDLIAQLSQSLKKDSEAIPTLESLAGAWVSEQSAEEIIAEIRSSRIFKRNTETLW